MGPDQFHRPVPHRSGRPALSPQSSVPSSDRSLADYYFADPRVVLVPIEHLSPAGVSRAFAALVQARAGWSAARVALFDRGFALYWERSAALARRDADWAPPRLRHVAVVGEPLAVHPYAPLLNTAAWTLYAGDLDPDAAHPEWVAYLLAHGDRMARTGEVTAAALRNAAWWFDRSEAERAAFRDAAARSDRPDAEALRTLAASLDWLRRLRHDPLRPPAAGDRAIPGSRLRVPPALAAAPPALVGRWTGVARGAVAAFEARWRGTDPAAVRDLLDWLAATAPPLLVLAARGRVLWDPATPDRVGALRQALARAAAAAVRDVHADLAVVDRHTRRFLAACTAPEALPLPAADLDQHGYVFLRHGRRLLAYSLDEPSVDRARGPALPYARAMLGARAVHEWAHLAVEAGWVPCPDPDDHRRRLARLAGLLDAAVAAAPAAVRAVTAPDLAALVETERAGTPGHALAALIARRMSDFQANLLAQRFLDAAERETYVRQNVRALGAEYPPAALWRMLARYLYEAQYLRFSAVADRRTFFVRSTWFDADILERGVLDDGRLDALLAAVAAVCDCHAVDEARFVR